MKPINLLIALTFVILAFPGFARADDTVTKGVMYKNPWCGCCEGHAEYLRANGYELEIVPTEELAALRKEHGVPAALEGCHMILIDGYVVEGHVPVSAIDRLLAERPDIKGISLPGMPQGSPGMSGVKEQPFVIFEISEGTPKVFAVE